VSGWTDVGENNLAFGLTRKRFVIEMHHLNVEGGVGENEGRDGEGDTPRESDIKVGMGRVEARGGLRWKWS
jgi:hypothetical protein